MTTILTAQAVHTIDAGTSGDAIAIDDGQILAVGSAADLAEAHPGATVDDRYGDQVILPGFVEAHAHSMAGGIWQHLYVGYFDSRGPDGKVWSGCRTLDAVIERLAEAEATLDDPYEPLLAWGLDPIYFPGERFVAAHLDEVSTTRPILVAHASMHLLTVNTAVMEKEGIDADTLADGVPKDGAGDPIGELQEPAAMRLAGDSFVRFFVSLMAEEGLRNYGRLAGNAGVTTIVDLGGTPIDNDRLVASWKSLTAESSFPARVVIFHNPGMGGVTPDLNEIAEIAVARQGESTDKLRFGPIKFVLDGSIQGYTARVTEPYVTGKDNGLWLIPPAQLADWIRPVVANEMLLHVHCNGDQAVDVMLDAFTEATGGSPYADHRTTIQHCQLTRPDQYQRMAELGMCANLFSNHFWYWGDQHHDLTVGPDRAVGMNAAASVLGLDIPLSIHSDAPVTPLGPLHVAWCAANRQTANGRVLGEDERLSVDQALHAITLGAAHQLRMEHEVGSITPGKRADLVVLDADPHDVGASGLRGLGVVATVLGGEHHPVG
ncbi:MAG: amidohydrolase [Acidimicrobiales bacterium]|jgi:predicted amidohydrolase YtcJ|nr:amidohydrolase [Acidimicrobiales bacterium]